MALSRSNSSRSWSHSPPVLTSWKSWATTRTHLVHNRSWTLFQFDKVLGKRSCFLTALESRNWCWILLMWKIKGRFLLSFVHQVSQSTFYADIIRIFILTAGVVSVIINLSVCIYLQQCSFKEKFTIHLMPANTKQQERWNAQKKPLYDCETSHLILFLHTISYSRIVLL